MWFIRSSSTHLDYITKPRMCGVKNEPIELIISSREVLAPKEYTNRHNNIAKVDCKLCYKINIQQNKLHTINITQQNWEYF